MSHEIFRPAQVAVITGAAGGIGYAAAVRLASLGMRVCLADSNEDALLQAAARLAAMPGVNADDVLAVPTDVSDIDEVQRLKSRVQDGFGPVAFLMNNAAVGLTGRPWSDRAAWKRVLDINLWGVINGLQTFVEDMLRHGGPALIVNVGSKQGITTPPGNAAYNVAKAGVKVLTEQLAHELRAVPDCRVTAHLLIPGFTFTGMTARAGGPAANAAGDSVPVKPPAAWTADQVVDFMMEGLAARDFYILCPDNQTTLDMDRRRMQWAADDLIQGRPALSRWHPDYEAAFRRHMEQS
jgi:NAD(P)-dependent dehydrogenase (short-subunit alcohol dehydrogenase family)